MTIEEKIRALYVSNKGEPFKIIEYLGCNNCTVQFEDGTILYNKSYVQIKNKQIKNPFYPSVYNVGFLGQGKFKSKVDNILTKESVSWRKIMERSYSQIHKEKNPTYKDVTVCKEWHNFQNFAKWYFENYIEGYQLDKDILFKGNKIYSPDTCCFVPREINSLFVKANKNRGELPIGVHKQSERYYVKIVKYNKQIRLGGYTTPEEAFECYKFHKEAHIKIIADEWKDKIDTKVYKSMYEWKVEITD